MLELLHDVSGLLNGGKTYYNRLSLIDGTIIDNDISKIPEDTKILLVSLYREEENEAEKKKVKIEYPKEELKGIIGNIYDVKDKEQADFLKNLKAR